MNKRLKNSVALFLIAALLVSVTGLALNRHTCFSSGASRVSVVVSANQGEDPECPHLKEHPKAKVSENTENLPPCCAAAALKAKRAESETNKADTRSKDCAGVNISQPSECCKNFTKVVSIDPTSVIVKHDLKIDPYSYVESIINNYGMRDKIDRLKQYNRAARDAISAPVVGLIRILRILNSSRQDSPEAA